MKYLYLGKAKFIIIEGKAYPVKVENGVAIVEIPDEIKVNMSILKPVTKKPRIERGSDTNDKS